MPDKKPDGKIKRSERAPKDKSSCYCEASSCACSCGKEQRASENKTITIIRLAVAAIMLLAGLILPLPQLYKVIVFVLSLLIAGYDIVISAAMSIMAGKFLNEDLLMILAAACSFIIGRFAEGAAIMLVFRFGLTLEGYVLGTTLRAVGGYTEHKPLKATVLKGDNEINVPAESVNAGDILVVRNGERVPLDGELIDKRTTLDTSSITGEAIPRAITAGSKVLSGCVNTGGTIRIRVTAKMNESALTKVAETIQEAREKKAPFENFVNGLTKYYTPIVVGAALLVFLIPVLILRQPVSHWLSRALVFLAVSRPCQLIIPVPLAYLAGIGGAAKNGILFRSTAALDDITKVSAVVFDKTGTLTTGKFSVTSVESAVMNRDMLLMLTAYAEYYSGHPLSQAVIAAYGGSIDMKRITDFRETAGMGVSAKVSGLTVLAGTSDFLSSEGVTVSSRDTSESTINVATNGKYIGRIMLTDNLKRDSVRAVDTLRQFGVERVVMMTGDRNRSAMKSAVSLGIKEVYAEYLPADKALKLAEIMEEQPQGKKTIFVGDGDKNARVISAADIGISMNGFGADAAFKAADVAIMNEEPIKVADAVKIAKETKNIVYQDIFIALGFKLLIMLLGAAGYIPFVWLAVLADIVVYILALVNSMRPYEFRRTVFF